MRHKTGLKMRRTKHRSQQSYGSHDLNAGNFTFPGNLLLSERIYRSLVEQSTDSYILVDQNSKIIEWNKAAETLFGISREAAIGQNSWDIQNRMMVDENKSVGTVERLKENALRLAREGQTAITNQSGEFQVQRSNGSRCWIQTLTIPLPVQDGFIICQVARDITLQHQTNETLRMLSQAVEQSPTSVVITDPEGAIVYANPKFSDLTGYTLSDVQGQNPRILKTDLTPPETHFRMWNDIKAGKVWRGEFCNKKKSGDLFWEAASISGVINESGVITHYVAVKEDITVKKQTEANLLASEERFRSLIEKAPLAIGIARNGLSLYANQQYCYMFGYQVPEDVIGRPFVEQVAPSHREETIVRVHRLEGGEMVDAEYKTQGLRKDGSTFPILTAATLVHLADGPATIVFITDITNQVRAEEKLLQTNQMLEAIIQASPLAITAIDSNHRVTLWSAASEKLFGWNEGEVIDKFLPYIPEGYQDEFNQMVADRIQGDSLIEFETRRKRKDGSIVEVSVSTAPLLDGSGNNAGIMAILTDISQRKEIERHLRESMEREHERAKELDAIMNSTPALVLVSHDRACQNMISNHYGYRFLDIHPGANVSLSALSSEQQRLHKAMKNGVEISPADLPMQLSARTGIGQTNFEYDVLLDDGSVFNLFGNTAPLLDEQGNPSGAVGVFIDISNLKRAEAAIISSEEKYKSLFTSMNEGFALYEIIFNIHGQATDYRFLDVNPAFERITGLSSATLIGKTMTELFPNTAPSWLEIFAKVAQTREPIRIEDYSPRIDRSYEIYAYSPETGKFATIFMDRSDFKKSEVKLRQSEADLRKAQRVSHVGSWKWDIQTGQLEWSDEMFALFGVEKASFTGSLTDVIKQAVHPGDRERVEKSNQVVIDDKKPAPLEYRVVWPDQSIHTVWAEPGELVLDAQGHPAFLTGIVQDITERKAAEHALRLSEERLNLAVQIAELGIWDWNLATDEVEWNAELLRVYGVSASEFTKKGSDYINFTHPDYRQEQVANIVKVLENKVTQNDISSGQARIFDPKELCIVRPDGSKCYTLGDAVAIRDEAGHAVRMVGVTFDITERKLVEEKLRQSEALFRAIILASPPAISVIDRNSLITFWSPSAERLFGWTSEEVIGKPLPILPKNQKEIINAQIALELKGNSQVGLETIRQKKDGTLVILRLSTAPLVDPNGEIMGSMAVYEDITEKKQAEIQLELSLQQLHTLAAHLQSIRDEERGRIAREIHDELGQSLTGIKMDLFWLKDSLSKQDSNKSHEMTTAKLQMMLLEIDTTIDSVRRISTDLRPSILDTLGLLPALEWLSKDFRTRLRIDCVFQTSLKQIDISQEFSTAIFRICQEALTNIARHASASRVIIRLSIQHGKLVVIIQDNGIGITEEDITRPNSLGILGMKERALAFQGFVSFSKAPRGGTRVTARFPAPTRNRSFDN
jgi:PAS domain S-box-containing protein